MPPIVPAIAAELSRGVRDALRQGAAVITGNQGNWIANGEPESIFGKTQQATARQYCRRYADDPGQYEGRFRVLAENACRPYLADVGYGSAPALTKPFSGGQCDNVLYYARVRIQPSGGAASDSPLIAMTGPVNIRAVPRSFSSDGRVTDYNIEIFARRWWFDGASPPSLGLPRWIFYTTRGVSTGQGLSATFVGLYRSGSSPDNCGDPPPSITDPTQPVPGPPRERFNPGPDIDIDIGVDINPDGTINIDFGTGPITIDPWADDDGGGSGGSPGPGPGDIGEPGAPVETGTEGDADGEAPPGEVLTGLKINFVTPPVGGNEYKEGIYRGVCYIYMGTSEGVDHDPAGAMLRDGQFIFAEKDNLTHWFVSANRGYNLRVTPYYRPAEVEDE